MARLALRLAGVAALLHPDGRATVLDRHAALLAARLALAGPATRRDLAALLWPDVPAVRAGANLRQRLLRLRQVAGAAWVQGSTALQLSPDVQVLPWQDPALGELLAGMEADAEPQLADWLGQIRQQRVADHVAGLVQQADAAEAAGQLNDALTLAGHLLRLEPLAEAAHRRVARLHYLRHDVARARSSLQALRAMLLAEFNATPSAGTLELDDTVRQAAAAGTAASTRTASGAAAPAAAALWRPPHLAGRAPELASLAGVLPGSPVLLLCGEAGLGKTRLLHAAAAARPAGQTLLVAAHAADPSIPFATLDCLADGVASLCPAAAPIWPAGADGPARQHALARALAHAGVQAVLLDDLQWADADSLAVLGALAATAPTGWVFSLRLSEASPALVALCDRLAAAGRLQRLTLAPLDTAAIENLLRRLPLPWLAPGAVPALAARVLAEVGGVPAWLLATLRAVPAGGPQADFPFPPDVAQAVAHRLQRLPPAALQLARVLAVAGEPADASVAAAVLQQPVGALADAWGHLVSCQLWLEPPGRFASDLVRAVVLAGLPVALRRGLHAAVATVLEAQAPAAPVDPVAVARHWEAAEQGPRAVRWWWRAAEQAAHQWRPRDEADALSHAIAHAGANSPGLAFALLLRQARVVVESDGLAAPLAPLSRALELADSTPQRILVLNRLAEVHFNRLMPDASRQCAEQALALALSPAPPATGAAPTAWPVAAAESVVRLHRALCMAGRAADAEQVWQRHSAWVEPGPWSHAELVSDRGWVLDRLGRAREALLWHHRGLALAQAHGRPVDEAVVLGNLAQGLLMAGQPAAAERALAHATAAGRRHDGLHQASDYNAMGLASAAAAQGHYAQALDLFDQALADTGAQSPLALAVGRLRRAVLWAEIGQTARALADLAPVLATDGLPLWTAARARRLAVALQPGPDADRLRAMQALLDESGDAAQLGQHGPAQLACLQLQWRRGPAEAVASWQQARRLWRQAVVAGHPGLRWAAHWVAAQAALAAGRPGAARRHASACARRSPDEVPAELPLGVWWHGLWRVWQALGDAPQAEAARAAGLQWIAQTQRDHLPAPFRVSFTAAVPAHQALLAGTPGAA
jgi:DNA-binding SARP family transcriptional activator/tetratricopeptide (TPR) repeat protein